jgi:Mg/Co/Ni transporter MgtE
VARLIQAADALAAPVVDMEGRLVGLVTVDDASSPRSSTRPGSWSIS